MTGLFAGAHGALAREGLGVRRAVLVAAPGDASGDPATARRKW